MSPRQRQDPPGGEGGDELAELVEELRAGQDELRTAIEELRSARTPATRRRAQRDVDAAESDLGKALRAAGFHDLSEDDLHELRGIRERERFERFFDERLERMGRELEDEADAARKGKGKNESDGKTSRTRARTPAGDDGDGDGGEEEADRKRRGYFS